MPSELNDEDLAVSIESETSSAQDETCSLEMPWVTLILLPLLPSTYLLIQMCRDHKKDSNVIFFLSCFKVQFRIVPFLTHCPH